jgi:hypothetical protein
MTVHIIAACADRKSLPPASRMRSIRSKSIDARLTDWRKRLRSDRSTRVVAQDLYLGEYWSVIRSLPAVAQSNRFASTLWVASAGYGLLDATARIHSYAATFTPDHPDSVIPRGADRRAAAREWWQKLTAARLLGRRTSNVESIARNHPEECIIVIGSPTYVSAMHDDLVAALQHTQQLTIITSPNGPMPELAPYTLYATARWQAALGGTLLSLHARVARELLQRGLDATTVRRSLGQRQQEQGRPARTPLSDIAVQRFIRKNVARTYSTALRQLRDAGFACEQSRFRRLFQATRQG